MITSTEKITKMVLIAGKGELPVKLAESATAQGVQLMIFALSKENFEDLKLIAPTFKYSLVEIYEMLDQIKVNKFRDICFIGKVPKLDFLAKLHKLDKRLINKVMELKDLNDDSLHFKLLDFLEKENGLRVLDQTIFLKHCFPEPQVFSIRQPSQEEIEEIAFGIRMAKGIGDLDIGQTVVVKNKSVIAVEAIEGTNKCIKRAAADFGIFTKDRSITVCKAAKPNQDLRFDNPTVGLQTIRAMPRNSILAFEAKRTFFVDQEAVIKYANENDMIVIAV